MAVDRLMAMGFDEQKAKKALADTDTGNSLDFEKAAAFCRTPVHDPVDVAIERLVAMGFDEKKAKKALAETDNRNYIDLEKAVEILVREESLDKIQADLQPGSSTSVAFPQPGFVDRDKSMPSSLSASGQEQQLRHELPPWTIAHCISRGAEDSDDEDSDEEYDEYKYYVKPPMDEILRYVHYSNKATSA
ncbi:MAG: hypothetical protein Q9218_007539 [Villophora microphyllina]